ncbi:1213_t:CDS:2 [Paraglomus occultum]|uniref:D-arabinono-1,4-lactone oxidase n=1 Tax=Paraglomus occultum TaxID=144539 RepID=A0A9N9BP04_9GLOM|nr:1213_t:CDS:2 [Paraglomus occultum]
MDNVINEALEQVNFGKLQDKQGSIVKRHLGMVKPESHGPEASIKPRDGAAGLPIPELEKPWTNWAHTITFTPKYTFRPQNLDQLIACVKKANNENLKIRCAGEGHSWSTISVTQSCLLLMNDLTEVTVEQQSNGDWVLHAEAGASISKIDNYLREHNPPLAMESMVVLTSITIGGAIAPGCHGATTEARTLAEQVVGLEIVTGSGELHKFVDDPNNPDEMSAARVSLGLLGVIYKVSFRVKPMFKLRMIDTLPLVSQFTNKYLENLVKNSFGIEVFYWPFNSSPTGKRDPSKDKLWVKTWKLTNDNVTYGALETTLYHQAQSISMVIASAVYQQLLTHPDRTPFITYLGGKLRLAERNNVWLAPDAIHYQAGIDSVLSLDTEFAIKIDNDFTNVITELHYIIDRIDYYQKQGKFPINLVAEFRILKSSKALLSTAYDDDPDAYYLFIEVLSITKTPGYYEFANELGTRWMKLYNARPHWAKYWENIPNIKSYLHEKLQSKIQRFEAVRRKYDPTNVFFDNASLRRVFYGA